MGKKLIITEKPSVARDFARVLGVSGNNNGFIENNEYVISWCYGHLVEMSYPEVYDEKYKTWRLEDLPFLPEVYKYGVIESAKDQYNVVHNLLYREDIDTVYWAGDSGKEGQTIEENIRNFGGVKEGMTELRVWIDSQTDDEIRRGIKEARPMSDYARLGKSGIMRTIEDYSLGINFSRALSVKYGRLLNDAAATKSYTAIAIGRVMTCVLGMVVNREREIRNFVETPFYRVIGNFSEYSFLGEWKALKQSKYVNSPLLYKENGFKKLEDADRLIEQLNGKPVCVDNIEVNNSKKKAPLLFNLAELQSECSKIFKISPSQTLDIIQELYEKKLTTYPRTDARVLTTAVAKEINKNLYGLKNYAPCASYVKTILDEKRYAGIEKTSYTDDKKVTDHYAIIPTGQTNGIDALTSLSKSVYDLIVRRFLAIFYPPAEYKNVKVEVSVESEPFYASCKVLTVKGYLEVGYQKNDSDNEEKEDSDSVLSKDELLKFVENVKVGDIISSNGYEVKEGKTSPPKRYTSGSLILAMENAGNLIEDEELREQIKKTGIGTSATRGEILEKLVRIKYLNQNNKTQIITPENLGEMIYEVVNLSVPTLLNPEMTANWESGLEGIINGTVDDKEYRSKLEAYIRRETEKMISFDLTKDIASKINPFTGKESRGIATRKPLGLTCPECGGELTTTSFGYGCSNYFNEEKKCSFNVGNIAGVDLDEEVFKTLIETGKTDVIDGFLSKSKKSFKAALKLIQNEDGHYNVSFDFSDVPSEIVEGVKCPVCGSDIVETNYGFSCSKRIEDNNLCYFSLSEIAGKKIDKENLLKLVNEGSTDIISGFKSKQKNSFSAKLVMKKNEDGKLGIEFDFSGIEPDSLEGAVCPDCGSKIYIKAGNFSCSSYKADDPSSCKFFIGKIAGKQLTNSNVCELINDGVTKTIRGFKSKAGKRFDACLVLKKDENGKSVVAFDFDNVEAKVIKDVVCPVCGGDIVKTSFGYGCKNYDRNNPESCKFNVGSIAGVKLNETAVKELLTDGITSEINGFKSKSGSKFSAKIALNKDEAGNVTGCKFVFDDENKEIEDCACPKCGGKIIKNKFGYHCEKYSKEEGACSFYIGKIAGLMLTEEDFKTLVKEKSTPKITGFTSKSGNSFEASLKFDEDYRVVFDFN